MTLSMIALILLVVLLVAAAAANFYLGRLPQQPAAGGDFVRVGKRELHYVESPGTEPTIVFIHGMPGLARDFDLVRERLAGHRTIAIDRPGYGWSKGGPLDFNGQLDAITQALHLLGVDRAVIAGHSFGGVVALGLALEQPQLVDKLLLLAPAAGGTRLGKQRIRIAHAINLLELPVVRQISDVFFLRALRRVASEQGGRIAYGTGPENAQQRHLAESVLAQHPSIRALANDRIIFNDATRGVDARLTEIDVPALIVHGNQDRTVPIRNGRRVADAIPNAEFEEVVADHVMPSKFPDTVAAAAERLIAGETVQATEKGRDR
jgi:pimeloyl-ACP methyl ester carboxylesterase